MFYLVRDTQKAGKNVVLYKKNVIHVYLVILHVGKYT